MYYYYFELQVSHTFYNQDPPFFINFNNSMEL